MTNKDLKARAIRLFGVITTVRDSNGHCWIYQGDQALGDGPSWAKALNMAIMLKLLEERARKVATP